MSSKWIAIAITVVLGMWTAIQTVEAATPGALELDRATFLWLGVLAAGLGTAQGFLPSVMPELPEPTIGEDEDDDAE